MKCYCNFEMKEKIIQNNRYFECPNCGYLMKEKIVSSEEEKKRYDAHICDDSYIKYMKEVYKKIEKYILGKSLDFGCGKLHALADILVEHGHNCDYYDLYYYPEKKNTKYDTIILIEVFEHVPNSLELLEELKNSLLDNGRLIIMTNVKKEPLENWWYLRDITHVRFVENKTMEMFANRLNMKLRVEKNLFVFEK